MATLPSDLHLLYRGWLHGNVVLCRGASPAVVDTGYHTGVDTLEQAILEHLGTVERIVLTHAHSDHAGGVAALTAEHPEATVWAHPRTAAMINGWDTRALWLDDTGQQLPPFTVTHTLSPGASVHLGQRAWTVLDAPGHATGGLALFDAQDGILITGDALWEDGFGILDPWTDGEHVFAAAARALDTLAATQARIVVPGHGAPFTTLGDAVDRARSRLAYLQAHPHRLRLLIARSCWSFLTMARPQLTVPDREALVRSLLLARGTPPEDLPTELAAVCTNTQPRPAAE